MLTIRRILIPAVLALGVLGSALASAAVVHPASAHAQRTAVASAGPDMKVHG